MTRLRLAFVLICLLAWTTGCRMCASDFDYLGPTVAGGCGGSSGACSPRAGSVLAGASPMAYAEETYYEPAPGGDMDHLGSSDFTAPIMPSQVIQGERIDGVIISVEDRLLEEAEPKRLESGLLQPTPAASRDGWSSR